MRYLKTSKNATATIHSLLKEHDWLIGCTATVPDDISTYTLETVFRYEKTGYFANKFGKPVFIEYGISRSDIGKYPFRLHDSLMTLIQDDEKLKRIVLSIIEIYDVLILEENMVDREHIYGKLGTAYGNEIVFDALTGCV